MFVDGGEVFYVWVTRSGRRTQRACPAGLPDAGEEGADSASTYLKPEGCLWAQPLSGCKVRFQG